MLRRYYFMLNPAPESDGPDLDDMSTFGESRTIEFEKLDSRRRELMRTDWSKETHQGDLT